MNKQTDRPAFSTLSTEDSLQTSQCACQM